MIVGTERGIVGAEIETKIGTDTRTATANNVGALRYRSDASNSWFEMVMQTGATTYAWVVVKTNTW